MFIYNHMRNATSVLVGRLETKYQNSIVPIIISLVIISVIHGRAFALFDLGKSTPVGCHSPIRLNPQP